MSATPDALTRLEHHLGRVLVTGLALSASALAAGLVLYLVAPRVDPQMRLLNIGLIVLMATPIVRVIVSIVEYIRMNDWFFVAATIAVLLEISISVLYALVGGR